MLKTMSQGPKSPATELLDFVAHARSRGMEYETIRHMLLAGGWKDREIASVFADEGLNMPIPSARQKGGAREAFYHLSAFTCLYVATVSLIMMLFSVIDVAMPDPAETYWQPEWTYSTIRSALSTVVVFAPLYLVFSWLIGRETRQGTIMSGGAVERWLTYLTLFVIVITVLVDAASLIYMLLEGEMTGRVLIKAFTLLLIVGGAFAYLWRGTYRWSNKPSSSELVGQA